MACLTSSALGGIVNDKGFSRTCLKCRRFIKVDQHGRVITHDRPLSQLPCHASGQLATLVSVQWGPGPRRTRQISGKSNGRRHDRRQKTDYLKPPEWLPNYRGEHLPTISLPAHGWFGVWLPAHTMWEHERKLSGWVGSDRSFRWDGRESCWTIAGAHFPRVSQELLRRHPNVLIGREYNPRERCNSSCKNARGFLCTCACRAKYHGRGKWRSGWTILGEFGGRRAGRPWHWMAVTVAS